MIIDMMGQVQLTNDGNAILREIDVTHPAAKGMIELARTQDEEVGDGTTSVIILAGEMLVAAEPFLVQNIHPTRIVKAYFNALDDAIKIIDEKLCTKVNLDDPNQIIDLVTSCLGTKFTHRYNDLMCSLAIEAVKKVIVTDEDGKKDIDIKRHVRIEKIPGGSINESTVIDGVMFEKDVLHQKMKRRIENPRILLLDCNIEYKKGENQTDVLMQDEKDFEALLRIEDEWTKKVCDEIIALKPDLVITEKGISGLLIFLLMLRRLILIFFLNRFGASLLHESWNHCFEKTEEDRQ